MDMNNVDLWRVRFKAFQDLCQFFGFVFVKVNFVQTPVRSHQRKNKKILEMESFRSFNGDGAVAEEGVIALTCLKWQKVAAADVKVSPGHQICLTMSKLYHRYELDKALSEPSWFY